MCGIALATDEDRMHRMLELQAHRGMDARGWAHFGGLWLGLNRLAIVDRQGGEQPLETGASLVAFNGELFNRDDLRWGMNAWTEVSVIEAIMRRVPGNFERHLDGYYGIVRIDKGRRQVIVSRDFPGVVPLYYQRRPFAIASESKALDKPKEVWPGETITFSFDGRIIKRRKFDPVSLHMEDIDDDHLDFLFERAVRRRIAHSEVKVSVALSGGLDSALVLAAAAAEHTENLSAVTIAADPSSDELVNAIRLCASYGVEHHVIHVTEEEIGRDREAILWHLEDGVHNPIKYSAMIRNYYVAKHAPGTVILCGEGADELGCGYPSHRAKRGLELECKSYQTLRSMHAINLDRVNKGGMAWTKEFRTPFLDRALILYCMACKKEPRKEIFRRLARRLDVPSYVMDKPKYGTEEDKLWAIVNGWKTAA